MAKRKTIQGISQDEGSERGSVLAPLRTLIVSTPGLQQESLRALLGALPMVQVTGTASGCLSALCMARELKPDLLVIDSNLPSQDVQTLVQHLKREGLRSLTLVLTTTRGQRSRALAAGADATVPRDTPYQHLVSVLEQLDIANVGEEAIG